MYDKMKVDIKMNGEKLKAFSLKSGTRHECLLHHSFNIVFEIYLQQSIKRKK
jgi:hypothetical protein